MSIFEMTSEPSFFEAIVVFVLFIGKVIFVVVSAVVMFFVGLISTIFLIAVGLFMALFSAVTGYGDVHTGLELVGAGLVAVIAGAMAVAHFNQ